jgi:hypothetical protein
MLKGDPMLVLIPLDGRIRLNLRLICATYRCSSSLPLPANVLARGSSPSHLLDGISWGSATFSVMRIGVRERGNRPLETRFQPPFAAPIVGISVLLGGLPAKVRESIFNINRKRFWTEISIVLRLKIRRMLDRRRNRTCDVKVQLQSHGAVDMYRSARQIYHFQTQAHSSDNNLGMFEASSVLS